MAIKTPGPHILQNSALRWSLPSSPIEYLFHFAAVLGSISHYSSPPSSAGSSSAGVSSVASAAGSSLAGASDAARSSS